MNDKKLQDLMVEINKELLSDEGVCRNVTKHGRPRVTECQVEAMYKVIRRYAKPAKLYGMEVFGDADILVFPRDK